jgi:hypothetical protein
VAVVALCYEFKPKPPASGVFTFTFTFTVACRLRLPLSLPSAIMRTVHWPWFDHPSDQGGQ